MIKKNKLSKNNCIASANSAAIIALGWYIFCSLFYIPFPAITKIIFQSWFPAINLQSLWSDQLLGQSIISIITFPLAVWITVYLFSKLRSLF